MSKHKNLFTISLDIISKYKLAIYGIATLWIVIFHGQVINVIDFTFGKSYLIPLNTIINYGNIGVDIFLFISGITLFYSFHKNPDMYTFIKKRFFRLFLPVILIDGLYWAIITIIDGSSIFSFLDRLLLLRFWLTGDQTIWFVSLIALLYLLYPYIYSFLFKNKSDKTLWIRGLILLILSYLIVICISKANISYYDLVEIALTRIPVFILGCILGKATYEKKRVNIFLMILIILSVIPFFIAVSSGKLAKYQVRFLYLVGGVALAYLFALIFHIINKLCKNHKSLIIKFFSFFGAFSLELYISHIMINQVFRMTKYYIEGDLLGYALVMGSSIMVAFIVSKIIGLIKRKFKFLNN